MAQPENWRAEEASPDSATALRGYRIMTVDRELEPNPRLRGLMAEWPKKSMRAQCLAKRRWGKRHAHTAPGQNCTCGIYNAWGPNITPWAEMQYALLFATASTGVIYVGPNGFRAEKTTLVAAAPVYDITRGHSLRFARQALCLTGKGIRTYTDPQALLRAHPPRPLPGIILRS